MIKRITIKRCGDAGFSMKIVRNDTTLMLSKKETRYFTNKRDVIKYLEGIDESNWRSD